MNDLAAFRELGISEITIDALRAKGFEAPSPIQTLTIPKLLEGSADLIAQAQTGTGKTAAFGIPILEKVQPKGGKPRALILAPTRELSIQIADEIASLRGNRAVSLAPFYGGQPIEIQLQRLKSGVDIVIGTPGRIMDLMRRKKLDFSDLQFAVLDEADEMLDMGFVEDIETILAETNADKRMLMFSATMPPEVMAIAERFMHNTEVVRAEGTKLSTELAEQIYFEVRREDKFEALARIIDIEEDLYALVFCRTRNDVDELVEKLKLRGYRVEALHGEIAQGQRLKVINQFKAKKFRILVATDVAARGLDVNDLSHVINYSMPQETDTYVHRIGRTGRAGKSGTAITFVTPAEYRKLTMIQRESGGEILKKELPGGKDIVEMKKQRFAELVSEGIAGEKHLDYLGFAEELIAMCETPAEALAAVLQLRFKGELQAENYQEFGRQPQQQKRDRRSWESMPDDHGKTRLFVGIGKLDGFGAVKMLDLIWEKAHIKKYRVGKIDCFDHFSFVDVDFEDAEAILKAFRNGGPRVQVANEDDKAKSAERKPRPESTERRPRPENSEWKPRAERPAARRSEKPAEKPAEESIEKRKPRIPADVKKRRLSDWVEKMSDGVELREKKAKGPKRKEK